MVICSDCRVLMRMAKHGFVVRDKATVLFPSTFWVGDLWRCPQCGKSVALDFGKPIEDQRAYEMNIRQNAMEFAYFPQESAKEEAGNG